MIKILNIIIFTLSSFFVFLWFYLFFSRKIRDINVLPIDSVETLVYIKTFLIISLGLFFLWLFLLIYRKILQSKTTSKFNRLTSWNLKFKIFIDKINILYKSYVMLFEYLGLDYVGYLINLSRFVLKRTQKQSFLILFGFLTLPRIVILLTFLIETYFGHLHYFFYTLFLLIIPLFFRIIIFMLTDVGPRLLPEFEKHLIKTPREHEIISKNGTEKLQVMELSFTEDVADLNLSWFLDQIYFPLKHIGPHMRDNVLPLYINIVQYTVLIYFFTISAGLIYILVCNI